MRFKCSLLGNTAEDVHSASVSFQLVSVFKQLKEKMAEQNIIFLFGFVSVFVVLIHGQIVPPGECLKGDKGDRGRDCLPGKPGLKGERGLDGRLGPKGTPGRVSLCAKFLIFMLLHKFTIHLYPGRLDLSALHMKEEEIQQTRDYLKESEISAGQIDAKDLQTVLLDEVIQLTRQTFQDLLDAALPKYPSDEEYYPYPYYEEARDREADG